ncbi:MAG: hypothetical protein ACRDT9_07405, partial [Agromyces sp.]
RGLPVALVALFVLLLPAMLRLGQRWTRRRRVGKGERPADAAWDEVIATARDLGAGGDDAETARAFATAVSERAAFGDGEARVALFELRDAVERERYGPDAASPASATDLLRDVASVRAALLADAAPAVRARAMLAPRSLFDAARRAFGERPSLGA